MIFGSNTLVVSLLPASLHQASLVEASLIDELQLIINPVALAAGTPLFKGLPEKTGFEFKSARPFQSGTVMLTYTPV